MRKIFCLTISVLFVLLGAYSCQEPEETTASGGIRFCAERTSDGHADRFWALALAVYAASSGSSYSRMELVGRKENGFIW